MPKNNFYNEIEFMEINYNNPRLLVDTAKVKSGIITWQTPSNIALIKYWGKRNIQLPKNPSISFTLNKAFTKTTIEYIPKTIKHGIEIDFYFEGERNDVFAQKIEKYFDRLIDIFPFINQFKFVIRSSNSFPHSAGIASSASAMASIALCLCSMEFELFGNLKNISDFRQKASYVARLGSGSAARSVFGYVSIWGKNNEVDVASDLYGIGYGLNVHDIFRTYHDDILIVSNEEKPVSSRAGHQLMEMNIFAKSRYDQANLHFRELLSAMRQGNLEIFMKIVESEALTLHALMMTSSPPYILMKPKTLIIIDLIRNFRKQTGLPVCFTLDAGPNIHLLYPDNIKDRVNDFVETQLKQHCSNGFMIKDMVGEGPIQL